MTLVTSPLVGIELDQAQHLILPECASQLNRRLPKELHSGGRSDYWTQGIVDEEEPVMSEPSVCGTDVPIEPLL